VLEIILSKIILTLSEKKLPLRNKKVNKQDDLTQALFDYIAE